MVRDLLSWLLLSPAEAELYLPTSRSREKAEICGRLASDNSTLKLLYKNPLVILRDRWDTAQPSRSSRPFLRAQPFGSSGPPTPGPTIGSCIPLRFCPHLVACGAVWQSVTGYRMQKGRRGRLFVPKQFQEANWTNPRRPDEGKASRSWPRFRGHVCR